MSDLIWREDAIDAIHEDILLKTLNDSFYRENHEFVTVGYVERTLLAVPTAQTEQAWIPCSKRLPERGGDVLITDEFGDVSIASIEYFSGMSEPWQWQDVYGIRIGYTVMAWMPLPNPWKGADDE